MPEDHLPPENRRSRRYPCVLEALCLSGGPGWLIRVLDVSTHGMAIETDEAMEVGTVLMLKPYSPSEMPLPRLQIRITRATRKGHAGWILGAEFLEPVSEEQLDLLFRDSGPGPT
jgi:hypothetical protein